MAKPSILAGDYSIADMAVYPWLRPYKWQGQDIAAWPNLQRWYARYARVPPSSAGSAVMADRLEKNREKPSGESWDALFGEKQFEPR